MDPQTQKLIDHVAQLERSNVELSSELEVQRMLNQHYVAQQRSLRDEIQALTRSNLELTVSMRQYFAVAQHAQASQAATEHQMDVVGVPLEEVTD